MMAHGGADSGKSHGAGSANDFHEPTTGGRSDCGGA